MDNRDTRPAVEPTYEDPPPREQKMWNVGIYATVAIVLILFVIVVLVAIMVF